MFPAALAIFLGAFLLFQVQPLVVKQFLPWFGGSPAVWTLCMLFFQSGLLLGYAWAHSIVARIPASRQAAVHGTLLVASLLTLPIIADPAWKPADGANPSFRILGLLATTVGIPYILLAATSPLIQAWSIPRLAGRSPYPLYALSNAASMLALLTYPLLIEPWLGTRAQAIVWSGAYLLFTALCLGIAFRSRPLPRNPAKTLHIEPVLRFLWLALAACGSALLLGVTNQICQEIAVVPFLWVVPLALYLLTFILCFESDRWYRRSLFVPFLLLAIGGVEYAFYAGNAIPILISLALFLGGLFVSCMVCHGELARLRPPPEQLTDFYLTLAIGGAAGGVFVAIIAPLLFVDFLELPLAIATSLILAVLAAGRNLNRGSSPGKNRRATWAAVVGASFILVTSSLEPWISGSGHVVEGRNFYGTLRVVDSPPQNGSPTLRTMLHGITTHGRQFIDARRHSEPLSYYTRDSGVGLAIEHLLPSDPRRIGVIGLGAGAISAYGRSGDLIRFYEINPLVIQYAREEFTYLVDSDAIIEVIEGDARLSLERENTQQYDLLIADAFSSDSIPVHLLTREAFELFARHLTPNGVLAIHVSNRHLDVRRVVVAGLSHSERIPVEIRTRRDRANGQDPAHWVIAAAPEILARLPESPSVRQLERDDISPVAWTDDYSNLFGILKILRRRSSDS